MDTFTLFYKHLIHPEYTVTRETHAVVKWSVNGIPRDTLLERNQLGKHVEHVVLEKLCAELEGIEGTPTVDVKLYMNYSPCNFTIFHWNKASEAYRNGIIWPDNKSLTCCGALKAFKQRTDVTLEVVFVSFYNILRPSCKRLCQGMLPPHAKPEDLPNHEVNRQGLKEVKAAGITLRTFLQEDWIFLASYRKTIENRLTEDGRMARDLQAILKEDDGVGVLVEPLENLDVQENE